MKLDPIVNPTRIHNITGMVFGKLTVISIAGKRTYKAGMATYFHCACECGARITVQRTNLVYGTKRCCGCSQKQTRTHNRGAWNHPLYKTWMHMFDRCDNPKNRSFLDYGARGITVCDRWRNGEGALSGFECFLADMGEKPSLGMMIDRIDNDLGYSPENCRWADRTAQNSNKRSNILVTIGSETRTVSAWARVKGVNEFTFYQRIRGGMDPVEAITKPIRQCAPRRKA